jgi:hypothetical protein
MTTTNENKIPVLVYTDKRGVFFGWVSPTDLETNSWRTQLTLTDARMAVQWAKSVHGVLGLAANGPNSECRITPAVPSMTLVDLHGVTSCTPKAVKAWESEPWSD